MIGSVAADVVAGRRYDSELWLSVDDARGPVGIAMRTAPYHLVVSPMPDPAARALGEHLADADPQLPGVAGPPEVVTAVLGGFGAGERAVVHMRELVRVLRELRDPVPAVEGRARPAVPGDLDLVADWMAAFGAEAGLGVQPSHDALRRAFDGPALARMRLWEVQGTPVALGGHAPLASTPVGNVGRIGPIYTPPAHRNHGYASGLTHALARELLGQCHTVMLHTDADNEVSNRLYARLGFEAVGDLVEVDLAGAGQAPGQ